MLGQEAGGCHVVVHLPVDEGRGDDGDESNEEENDLPGVEALGLDVTQAVRQGRGDDGGQAIGSIPRGDAERLFRASIPLIRDDAEEGKTGALEQSQEEARRQESRV